MVKLEEIEVNFIVKILGIDSFHIKRLNNNGKRR